MESHAEWNELWVQYDVVNQKKMRKVYEAFAFGREERQSKVLDLGCGSGHFVQLLRAQGFTDVEGWEPQEDLVKQDTSGLLRAGNCLDDQGRTAYYDVITMIGVLHHLRAYAEVQRCIQNLRGMLKDGGRFYSVEPRSTLLRSVATVLMVNLPTTVLPRSVQLDRAMYLQERVEFNQWLGYEKNVTQEFLKSGFVIERRRQDWRYRYIVFGKQ